MKSFVSVFVLLLLAVPILIPSTGSLYAQEAKKGNIEGKITASDDGMGLPNANIVISGTNIGVSSDLKGYFILKNLSAGKIEIKASFVGYRSQTVAVDVVSGKTTELNIVLEPASVQTEEVIITAQAKGQVEAINRQLNSNTIANVVSPERIKENPNANAAEAIGHLPGVSLVRSGGEGTQIIIRGLDAKYSNVTIDGVQLPSTSMTDRSSGISGLSQYLLEGVELFKSITPDMDGNSVAGSINLALAPAPAGMNFNILAQTGYNDLNDYWGNYAFQISGSQRFFDDKLGVKLSFDAERVNRGRQTLGASYSINSNITSGSGLEPVYLSTASLNNIQDIKSKQAATLVLDWKFSNESKIIVYNFFSRTGQNYKSFSKSYNPSSTAVYYNGDINDEGENLLYSGIIKGNQVFSWADVDYGTSFSQSHVYTPLEKTYTFSLQNAYNSDYTTRAALLLPLEQLINASYDNSDAATLSKVYMSSMGYNQNDMLQKDFSAFFNIKSQFRLNDYINGYVKGGAKYKYTDRYTNILSASQNIAANPQFVKYANKNYNWVETASIGSYPSALPFAGGSINGFLDHYNFGWDVNYGRLSDLWDWWKSFSDRVIAENSISQTVGQYAQIGFVPDFYGSSANNQDIIENYYAGYIMTSINIGELITFIPGVRYEKVTDKLVGNYVYNLAASFTQSFPRDYVSTDKESEFFLPNIHMTIKPLDWLRIQAAYTKTLSYPSYNQIVPNTYINNSIAPYAYQTGNPGLKPEQWSSYDLLVAVFNNEIGLLSVDGFYKEVKDYIWTRTYSRIPGDPLLPGFTNNQTVITTESVNNNEFVYIKGLEFEWQTNFWYLPKPFNYFSLNVNYTILDSKATYPAQRLFTTFVTNNGKTSAVINRVDSTATGPMLYQPDNIANVSLGFNYEGFNLWVSYQYNGSILTSWNTQQELTGSQSDYERWDLQVSQKLPVKGLVLRFNVANINNVVQTSNLKGDSRPTYQERYGWTSDLGVVYNF